MRNYCRKLKADSQAATNNVKCIIIDEEGKFNQQSVDISLILKII